MSEPRILLETEQSPGYEKGAWAIIWKEDGEAFKACPVRDCLLSFGMNNPSWETAMEKVVQRLSINDEFARDFAGGAFFPVLISAGIKVVKVVL